MTRKFRPMLKDNKIGVYLYTHADFDNEIYMEQQMQTLLSL